jgi:hypothetical protein
MSEPNKTHIKDGSQTMDCPAVTGANRRVRIPELIQPCPCSIHVNSIRVSGVPVFVVLYQSLKRASVSGAKGLVSEARCS